MMLSKPLVVQCKRCGEIIEVGIDLECVFSQERSMGIETQFQGLLDDACPHCGNPIAISIDVWEYPSGAINYVDTEEHGIKLIEQPCIDVDEYNDI